MKHAPGNVFSSTSSSSCNLEACFLLRKKAKSLRILTCNFQSLWNKRPELGHFLVKHDIDILTGSETHLSPSIWNSEIIPPNYSAIRKDRDDGYGGVIIIYKNTFLVEVSHQTKSEIVTIKIETSDKPVIISSCYRPPKCIGENFKYLLEDINRICKSYPVWLGEDFNLPDIDWEN